MRVQRKLKNIASIKGDIFVAMSALASCARKIMLTPNNNNKGEIREFGFVAFT